MKDRQKRLLRFLLTYDGVVRIEDLASTFSIGKRTVSRDLDLLESWLSLRGALLERKTNHGIQVITFGKTPEDLLEIVNTPNSYIENLSPEIRQKLCQLYLIFHNREIKISELSQTFFASDTTIWNDLNQIDVELAESGFTISRMKGVGIALAGDELSIRLQFLQVLTKLFSSHTIIPYLYNNIQDQKNTLELNQFRLLMKRIHFPETSDRIMNQISDIERSLGYHYTMSAEAVLYFYLQITLHRIKSGALLEHEQVELCHADYLSIGEIQLKRLLAGVFSGRIPAAEIQFFGLLLQVLEIGDVSDSQLQRLPLPIDPRVTDMVSEFISTFSLQDNTYYYLDDYGLRMLHVTITSLILRKQLKIPIWHGEWGSSYPRQWNSESKNHKVREDFMKNFSVELTQLDTETLLMQIYALAQAHTDPPKHKLRCLICCFEGIGLAIYLKTIIDKEYDELDVIEATAVYKIRQSYIEANKIDLIITTYPIENTSVPSVLISLPLNREMLTHQVLRTVESMKLTEKEEAIEQKTPATPKVGITNFSTIFGFLERFKIYSLDHSEDIRIIIQELSEAIGSDSAAIELLTEDFLLREELSPLFFEDYNVRLLHCKSKAVSEPYAGVIDFHDPTKSRMLFLIAPDPCPDPIRLLLSEITTSFLSDELFRKTVITGDLRDMQKHLLDVYKDFF